MDVVVIILFALSLSIAHNLIDHQGSVLRLAAEVSIEIFSSLIVGIFFALILGTLLYDRRGAWARPLGVVISSALVFFITAELQHSHLHLLGFPVHIEPLLACLTIGVWINNVGTVGEELEYELHRLAPLVYVTFFTITGASLNLELLALVWPAALLLFVIRLIGIGLGSVVGGMIASEPREQHRYRWMGFVTQAGVGLGLAERVSHEFPDWGERFAVLMIAVIVLNEMIGPLFFKRAVVRSGEVGLAHAQSESSEALSEEEAHMNSTESSPTAST
jgi:Kef-type K+ transport system membrane component KefB